MSNWTDGSIVKGMLEELAASKYPSKTGGRILSLFLGLLGPNDEALPRNDGFDPRNSLTPLLAELFKGSTGSLTAPCLLLRTPREHV
jgi:hypothetical protein